MKAQFQWIGGATFILSIDDVKIAVDPVLCKKGTVQDYFWFKSKRIEDPIYSEKDFENIDLWLITHNHEDHLDEIGLSKISNSSKIISNQNAAKVLLNNGKKNVSILKWKQKKVIVINNYTIEIEAIPAIHGINPLSALLAGKVNGYYLTISNKNDTKSIYITSDTVYKERIIKFMSKKKIDFLVANMGAAMKGTWIMNLTLDAKMLQKMITKLKPKMVIPVHYGTFQHYKEPVEKIKELKNYSIKLVAVGSKTQFDL